MFGNGASSQAADTIQVTDPQTLWHGANHTEREDQDGHPGHGKKRQLPDSARNEDDATESSVTVHVAKEPTKGNPRGPNPPSSNPLPEPSESGRDGSVPSTPRVSAVPRVRLILRPPTDPALPMNHQAAPEHPLRTTVHFPNLATPDSLPNDERTPSDDATSDSGSASESDDEGVENVHCWCQGPARGDMIRCDRCLKWVSNSFLPSRR